MCLRFMLALVSWLCLASGLNMKVHSWLSIYVVIPCYLHLISTFHFLMAPFADARLAPYLGCLRYHSTLSKAERFAIPVTHGTLPRGFLVSSTYAGIKKAISPSAGSKTLTAPPKPDMSLIVSSTPAAVAGVFTTNRFQAAPVVHSKAALQSAAPRTRAVLTNSGCANAVTGQGGLDDTNALVSQVRSLLRSEHSAPSDALMMSTGVIGVRLPLGPMQRALSHLASSQVLQSNPDAWMDVARAFMTTDTFPKLRTRRFALGDRVCHMAAIDKGAGMIHPRMESPRTLHATLLGVFVTDAPIAPDALQRSLDAAVKFSFNCVSVDGDMSTNDTILALANGAAPTGAPGTPIAPGTEISEKTHPVEMAIFQTELKELACEMAQLIVRDGEGAEKFVEVRVRNAATYDAAHAIAASISTSALVKCAMHGADANWGRVLCAAGYAKLPPGWEIDPCKVNVTFTTPNARDLAPLRTLIDGVPQMVNEEHATRLLSHEDICIDVDLQGGSNPSSARAEAVYWTCDFSKEYIAVSITNES